MITIVEKTNPKKPGTKTHARYKALLKAAGKKAQLTEEDALAAGYTRADLRWDRAKGFVK